jgi:hypothetical protein
MHIYKREIGEILRRFIACEITYPECLAALDAALDAVVRELDPRDLPELQSILASNHDIVAKQMARSARYTTEPPDAAAPCVPGLSVC